MATERFEPRGTGRNPVEVNLIEETEIGRGSYGAVYSVVAEIQNGETIRKRRMVIKRYDTGMERQQQQHAQQAVKNYKRLKTAGVKVFTTFRLGPDRKSILMTNGHSDDWVCVGTNIHTDRLAYFPELQRDHLDTISNFSSLVQSVFADGKRAAAAGLLVNLDGLFILINRTDHSQLDYVFGDLDETGAQEAPNTKAAKYNLERIKQALQFFLEANMVDPEPWTGELNQLYAAAEAT